VGQDVPDAVADRGELDRRRHDGRLVELELQLRLADAQLLGLAFERG
jgi:hypothetical protein